MDVYVKKPCYTTIVKNEGSCKDIIFEAIKVGQSHASQTFSHHVPLGAFHPQPHSDTEFEYVDEAVQNTIENESSKKTIENEDEYSLDAVVKRQRKEPEDSSSDPSTGDEKQSPLKNPGILVVQSQKKKNTIDAHDIKFQSDFDREVKDMSVSEFMILFLDLDDRFLEILRILQFSNNHVKTNDKAWKKKRKRLPTFIPDKELRKTTGSMDAYVPVNAGVGVLKWFDNWAVHIIFSMNACHATVIFTV
ncbi:unnamed protein product [Lepeophtheirus salmonis]|uniref:(salmon louse) hypothetical protein n=1 Tax=Lepeophtheirus salmonis TaxID=72036 RepID=A0A7R8HCM5_LEPSM|nr:unnamed protein product [Lepeophtheirus salmonis]CAF3005067.1 unnamed protein product [Lepeophtheirus salmonis]